MASTTVGAQNILITEGSLTAGRISNMGVAVLVRSSPSIAAIARPFEVGTLLRAIDGYTGHEVTVMAKRLSPHVLLRPGKLRQTE